MSVGEFTSSELNTDFLVTANKDLSDKFNIVANIGGNMSKRTSEGLSNSGESFKIPTKFFLSNQHRVLMCQTLVSSLPDTLLHHALLHIARLVIFAIILRLIFQYYYHEFHML